MRAPRVRKLVHHETHDRRREAETNHRERETKNEPNPVRIVTPPLPTATAYELRSVARFVLGDLAMAASQRTRGARNIAEAACNSGIEVHREPTATSPLLFS